MKYYCLEICERHGEREHNQIIRVMADNLEVAEKHMSYWLGHWYSADDSTFPTEPDEFGDYYYCGGEIAVSEGFIREISESTYKELIGIIADMTLKGVV